MTEDEKKLAELQIILDMLNQDITDLETLSDKLELWK